MKRLIEIQQELKAPKNQKNNFGGYNYRSCEDILEAVKPHLQKHNLLLVINDSIEAINTRFYVRATATIYDETGKKLIETSALAREEESKKGMDASQLTGATSSYARKYALNGLFAIDDTKDADATNKHNKETTDNDIDIIEGLKATENIKNLNTYFNNYKNKVVDLKKFQQAYTTKATQLKKEVQND